MDLMTLTFHEDDFLYQQLYEYIKELILDNKLVKGDKLPSKKKLSKHLEISENTVETAYEQLLIEGFITSEERRGYFVEEVNFYPIKTHEPPDQELEEKNYTYDFNYEGIEESFLPITNIRRSLNQMLEDPNFLMDRSHPQGLLELRENIQKYLLSSRGVSVSPKDIIISSGIDNLYEIIYRVLGDDKIYGAEDPGYDRLYKDLKFYKATIIPLSLDESGISMSELMDQKIDVLNITPSHQFPSGIIYPITRRLELLDWAKKNQSYIIEDDYDSDFRYLGRPIPALKSYDNNQQVIYLGSFSKSFSPALRISYMILPKRLYKNYLEIVEQYPCPVSSITQKFFSDFMEQDYFNRHLNRMRTHYKKKRNELISFIQSENLPITLEGAEAGLHLVLNFHNWIEEKKLIEIAKDLNLRIFPFSKFYKKPFTGNKILIGYANSTIDEMKEGLDKFFTRIRELKFN